MLQCIKIAILLCFLSSCSRSPVVSGVRAEENKYNMAFIKIGMSQSKVYNIMGCPQDVETLNINEECYVVWFYLTKRFGLGQTRLLPQNLTPIVFKNEYLVGWGNEYYKYLLNIENEKGKRKSEFRQEYTDDEHEWSPERHSQIPEPAPQSPLPLQ